MTALGENVVYDEASAYAWSDLNETEFLERVVAELRAAMGDAFGEHTFFILSSHDPDVRPASIGDPAQRKVLIFVSDESASVPDVLAPHYKAVFKSYLPRELPGTNIFPFSLGYVRGVPAPPPEPILERSISVFFSGSLGPARRPLYRALHPVYRRLPAAALDRALSDRKRLLVPEDLSHTMPDSVLRFTRGFRQGHSAEEYGALLADARIALCPHGARNPETFRHIEAMRAGAVVVSEPLPDTHFYRGAPFVTVEDWPSGMRAVRELLASPARLQELQDATLAWWDSVCSERATARYVAERLMAT